MTVWREPIDTIRKRLMPAPEVIDDSLDFESDWMQEPECACPPVPAAVLIALIARQDGYCVLFTERSAALRSHSGQVAFPGGKIEPGDAGPAAAALREAEEEVGLKGADVEILGYLPSYYSSSNYLITPVVAVAEPQAPFAPDPREVSGLFEVPLALLARPQSYSIRHVERRGVTHTSWQIVHEGHMIWGITGNLTRRFFETALKEAG